MVLLEQIKFRKFDVKSIVYLWDFFPALSRSLRFSDLNEASQIRPILSRYSLLACVGSYQPVILKFCLKYKVVPLVSQDLPPHCLKNVEVMRDYLGGQKFYRQIKTYIWISQLHSMFAAMVSFSGTDSESLADWGLIWELNILITCKDLKSKHNKVALPQPTRLGIFFPRRLNRNCTSEWSLFYGHPTD